MTSIYRYFDPADRLIYVGITSRGMRRQLEHDGHASWWSFVARQEVEHCDTRSEAERLEQSLIRAHHPPFNTQHNDLWQVVRPAYLALIAAESDYASAVAAEAGAPARGCGHCAACLDPVGNEACRLLSLKDTRGCAKCGRRNCYWPDGVEHGIGTGWADGHAAGVADTREAAARREVGEAEDGVVDVRRTYAEPVPY